MHELGIAQAILDAVRTRATGSCTHSEIGRERPVKVGIRLGEVSGVNPDALLFSFEALVRGTEFAALGLEVERVPHRRRCPICRRVFDAADLETACPDCGNAMTDFLEGDELEIAFLELEET